MEKKINGWTKSPLAAKEKRHRTYNRFRRHGVKEAYNRYETVMDNHTKVRKETEIEYQRDIIHKYKDEPKYFPNYIKKQKHS